MISKEIFIKIITMIQEQEKIDEEIGHALEKVCGSFVIFGTNNLFRNAVLLLLKEVCNDCYDYIGWWLYETDDYRIWYKDINDEEVVLNLKNIEDFYKYIVESQDEWIDAKNERGCIN